MDGENGSSSPPLLKTVGDLKSFIETFKTDIDADYRLRHATIRKGLVVFLHSANSSQFTDTARRLIKIAKNSGLIVDNSVDLDVVKSAISYLLKSVEKKKKNLARDGRHLVQLFHEDFNIPFKNGSSVQSVSSSLPGASGSAVIEPVMSVDEKYLGTRCISFKKGSSVQSVSSLLPGASGSAVTEPVMSVDEKSLGTRCSYQSSPKKLKSDCGKCLNKRIALAGLVAVNRKRKRQFDEMYISSVTARSLRQALERKTKIELKLRVDRRKLNSTVIEKDRTIRRLKKGLGLVALSPTPRKKCKCKHMYKLSNVEKERNALKKRCHQLELENESLRAAILAENEAPAETVSVKKDSKTYSSSYRKAAYACILHQVPVEETSSVIEEVVQEISGLKLEFKANATTVAQFAYEVGVLNDIQVCEAVMANENLTIGLDATSLSSEHINEVHLMFPGNPPWGLELQINSLAGGKTEDYVGHVTEALYDISDSYALFNGKSSVDVRNTVVSKLKNTISDRVSVNHCVWQQLQEDLSIHLLEMNCNVHPLDGIAGAVRSTLKKIDGAKELKGQCYGRTCCADNLVYGISKMRFKQGSGDPKGFKMFLKKEGIRSNLLIRYVGNRLHVIFHMSGVLFASQPILMKYFKSVCNNTSSLRTAIIHDFSDPSILLHLRALGLLGKLLTGPWMTVFYANKEGKSNLEVVPELKMAVANLRHLTNNPLSVLTVKSDMFGHMLYPSNDDVLVSLQSSVDPELLTEFEEVMKELIDGTIKVLERQLKKYLTGDLSAPTPEMLLQAKSTPIHNIFSERVLGMTDSQTRRAPNATVGFIDAKVKCAQNKTLNWLKRNSGQEQEKLISFAIKRARQVRTLRKKREEYKQKVFMKRQDVKKQERDQTYRRKIDKPLKELVASNPEHLDEEKLTALSLPEEKYQVVKDIISNKGSLIDKYIDQYWFFDRKDVLYHGRILSLKTPKSGPYYNVSYWVESEGEEDGEDSRMPVQQLLTDYILGDLIFV